MRVTPSFLDGVFMALSAAPGTVAILDAHRCEMERAHANGGQFDRGMSLIGGGPFDLGRRLYAVPWKSSLDATGTEDALRRMLLEVSRRHPEERIVVLRGLLSLFIHTDVEGVLSTMPPRIRDKTVVIGQQSADDDWVEGWRAVQDAFLPALGSQGSGNRPLVTGFCVHRSEGDESGNILELNRLFAVAGLEEPYWLLGGGQGRPEGVTERSLELAFPFGDAPEAPLRSGTRLELPQPLGFKATEAMLATLARHTGREQQVGVFIDETRRSLETALLSTVAKGLSGRGAMVVGDPWRARGLTQALEELGLDVSAVVFLRRQDRLPTWAREGTWARRTVLCDPPYASVQELMEQGVKEGSLDIVVGAGLFRDAAELEGLASVEIGYPSYLEHFLVPSPFMGFQGILNLAQRLDNALGLRQYRRYRLSSPRPL